MARLNPSLALGLALLASCLLALPRDARASPRDRLVGGVTDLKPNDPQVQKAAQAAVASYNMGSNSLYYFRDTRILKAQSQVRLGWRDAAVRRAAGRQVTEESESNQAISPTYFQKLNECQIFTMNQISKFQIESNPDLAPLPH